MKMIGKSKFIVLIGAFVFALSMASVGYGFWTDRLGMEGNVGILFRFDVNDDVMLEAVTKEAIQQEFLQLTPELNSGGEDSLADPVLPDNPPTPPDIPAPTHDDGSSTPQDDPISGPSGGFSTPPEDPVTPPEDPVTPSGNPGTPPENPPSTPSDDLSTPPVDPGADDPGAQSQANEGTSQEDNGASQIDPEVPADTNPPEQPGLNPDGPETSEETDGSAV